MIRWLWKFINDHWWAWRSVHVGWAASLSRFVAPGAGATWYASQETNQARAAGKVQWKNVLDFLAGCIGEALGQWWRAHA